MTAMWHHGNSNKYFVIKVKLAHYDNYLAIKVQAIEALITNQLKAYFPLPKMMIKYDQR